MSTNEQIKAIETENVYFVAICDNNDGHVIEEIYFNTCEERDGYIAENGLECCDVEIIEAGKCYNFAYCVDASDATTVLMNDDGTYRIGSVDVEFDHDGDWCWFTVYMRDGHGTSHYAEFNTSSSRKIRAFLEPFVGERAADALADMAYEIGLL